MVKQSNICFTNKNASIAWGNALNEIRNWVDPPGTSKSSSAEFATRKCAPHLEFQS